jgi:hypothetical protein
MKPQTAAHTPTPWNENDTCSRCGIVGQTIWHVCEKCTELAEIEYQHECALLANDAYDRMAAKS